MITEFCTPAELRLCCLMAYGMEINRGGQCSQDKKMVEEGALILLLLLCGKKHLRTHSVCRRNCILARTSMFTASDDISRMPICPAYRPSLGTG